MKIAASDLTLQSQHAATTRYELNESLRAWVGDRRPEFEGRAGGGTPKGLLSSIQTTISASARDALAAQAAATSAPTETTSSSSAAAIEDANDAAEHDPIVSLIKRMVEMLTGHKIKVYSGKELANAMNEGATEPAAQPHHTSSGHAQQTPARAGYGVEYERHESYQETESTTFSAQGTVLTADGKEIRVTLDLAMSRQYSEQSDISLRAGDAVRKDPLVINFGGNAAQLSDQSFRFDLDADGQKEEVALLSGNSGYLALDLNNNGRIDSGKELFGPASGSGFSDLAHYDQDGNGWIDENDQVFSKLRVWQPAAGNSGTLTTLAENGVGALALGATATPFALRGSGNSDLGTVRESGLYLREDGSAGTLQEIDLTI